MSDAALSANLSTSAVSLQMKKLAQELKTELFFRSGNALLPTPACRRLADQAREVIARFNVIEQEFQAHKMKKSDEEPGR